MSIFGLMTKREVKTAIEAAVKEAITDEMPRWLLEHAEAEKYNMPDPSVYANQADLYRKLSWVLQAVDITSASAALTPFSVKRVIRDREPKDIPNHPFELLMRKPNPMDSRYEFLYGTVAMFMLTGNAYWWLNRATPDAPPDELWLIPSSYIIPVPDENMFIRGYYYYPGNGREMLLEPSAIVHFRRFNPFSRYVGLSAIESLAVIAGGDLAMQQWNTRLFAENNARLPGILTFEQFIADPTWQKIKDDTREASKKRELLMLRGVGAGGVNWLQNAVSQKEMEFLQGRDFNREEIYATLAPGLYAMLSESATEANSRTGAAVFNERTVYPKHVLVAEKITNAILPSYGGRELLGEFEDIRIVDRQLQLQEQDHYARTHTIREIREEYYGDDPLGDERDQLLPAQVNAQSGGIQEPPPSPFAKQPVDEAEREMDSARNAPPSAEPTEAQKSAVMALFAWQRRAVKRVGHPVDFDTQDIPTGAVQYVNAYLPTCRSVSAVKSIFDNARDMVSKPAPKPNVNDAALVLEGIRLALSKEAG